MRMVTAQDKPKSRLETDAPLGPKCKTRMQVRTLSDSGVDQIVIVPLPGK